MNLTELEAAAMTAINDIPKLQSLLYDIDLLPEQLERGSKEWRMMLIICMHVREWKKRDEDAPVPAAEKLVGRSGELEERR